MNYTTTITMNC